MTYAGDISAAEAWRSLEEHASAVLIDVRSHAEWTFVGLPDLRPLSKTPVLVEWQVYPTMGVNPDFVASVLAELRRREIGDESPLLFLCRSGGRSRAAAEALTATGRKACWNISGGFEGDVDRENHRGKLNGWKAQRLPWVQS